MPSSDCRRYRGIFTESYKYDHIEAANSLRNGELGNAAMAEAISVLYQLKAVGSFANAIVVFRGPSRPPPASCARYRLQRFVRGQKPSNWRGVQKAFKQISDWKLSSRTNGSVGTRSLRS